MFMDEEWLLNVYIKSSNKAVVQSLPLSLQRRVHGVMIVPAVILGTVQTTKKHLHVNALMVLVDTSATKASIIPS